jgi:hypothetical protein
VRIVCLAIGIALPLAHPARRDLFKQSGVAISQFSSAGANLAGGARHLLDFGAAYAQALALVLYRQPALTANKTRSG